MTVISTQFRSRSFSPEQTGAIEAELASILSSASFAGSNRCQEFLEFIIRRSLAGDYEHLTERFIGAELFGRPIDYETATDSIVRVRANDVRRRLAQHYLERKSVTGVSIAVVSGTYIPEFHWSDAGKPDFDESASAGVLPAELLREPELPPEAVIHVSARKIKNLILFILVLLLAAGVLTAIWLQRSSTPRSALERFWQPVVHDGRMTTVCFGNGLTFWVSPDLRQAVEDRRHSMSLKTGEIIITRADTATAGSIRAALSIINLLSSNGVANQLRWDQEVQETELNGTNVVYIGAFNNDWTMSLNQSLRFSFVESDTTDGHTWEIRDRMSPDQRWLSTKTYPQLIAHDYALVTRIIDPVRKRVVISVGGLNQFGTQAAGEFVTDKTAFDEFARSAPKGWEQKDIQIVLEMEVSGRRVINPRIIATHVW